MIVMRCESREPDYSSGKMKSNLRIYLISSVCDWKRPSNSPISSVGSSVMFRLPNLCLVIHGWFFLCYHQFLSKMVINSIPRCFNYFVISRSKKTFGLKVAWNLILRLGFRERRVWNCCSLYWVIGAMSSDYDMMYEYTSQVCIVDISLEVAHWRKFP